MRIGRSWPARIIRKKPIYGVLDPTLVVAAYVTDLHATISWQDNSTYNTTYTLERKRGSDPWVTVSAAIDGAATSHVDPEELEPGVTYSYRLTAIYTPGGTFSNTVTITTEVPPEAPSDVSAACTVRATSNGSKVQLAWNINSETESGFKIERSLNNVDWSTVTTTDAGVRTYEDTGLAHDTTYYYRISAVGVTATSNPATAVTVKTSRGRVADLLLAFDKKTGNFPS